MSNKAPNNGWWRGGVIYQIYPRSFQDSNGDGIGDLPGITQRLDHIAALGADGIWISPFFKSPMKDFGYDVSDYCDVDPMFGTLDDFRALVARAHQLGLKVMIDQVLSHCSDQHPWFVESRSSRDNPKADWFVWADAKDDGNPPNNWLSIFGGSAWQWDTRRCQYYLHNFLTSQPDLNFHNPQVQDALLATVKFWLDLGVDGYRLDTVNFFFHDAQLRDNPGRGAPDPNNPDPAVNPFNPYGWQRHVYDKSRPENLPFLQRLRALLDQYPDTTMVGEIGDDDGLARVAEYTAGGDKLHMAYCFDLLGEAHDAPFLHGFLQRFSTIVGDGWPCWALSNHDVVRSATRWGGPAPDPRLLRLAAAFQVSLRGTVCLYQGEELGLPEAELRYEDLQDPYGITMWPQFKGRDGCRTPMPWSADAPQAGFTTGARPWLPVAETHRPLAVDQQTGAPESMLSFVTRLLHWRRDQPALRSGRLSLLPPHPQLLAFTREHEQQTLLCVFNFSDQPAELTLPAEWQGATVLGGSGLEGAQLNGDTVRCTPWGGLHLRRA
ncbi:alpha-glucosidase family protein [Hydrogenophaga pseudoflava]|uniref:alpha-glucosidase family protein n=1 Tax=Hydrogenophaga pseudoflava TaxID=47421 RepID=UPI0027E44475|nr:alpha-glucosidase family protein [Hydrogenophaga pseudoflava]MDQ7745329.1 alpha-glucosidase family protein [Hydrogenophaga pseudoflava]